MRWFFYGSINMKRVLHNTCVHGKIRGMIVVGGGRDEKIYTRKNRINGSMVKRAS
jgi:hypothetical protein